MDGSLFAWVAALSWALLGAGCGRSDLYPPVTPIVAASTPADARDVATPVDARDAPALPDGGSDDAPAEAGPDAARDAPAIPDGRDGPPEAPLACQMCPPGTLACDGVCVDPARDRARCGSDGCGPGERGQTCAPGLACVSRACAACRPLAAPRTFPALTTPAALAAGDFDGDGNIDILVASHIGVRVWLGDGRGNFSRAGPWLLTGFASGSASERMQVGDVNLDGHLDAIIGQNADYAGYPSGVVLLLGNGDGSFAAPTMVVSGRTAAPALIDTDGDGRLDIVSATTAAPFTLSVRLGNGDGSFRPPMDQSLPTATAGPPLEIDAVDLDGSGRLDLVLPIGGSSATSALEVLYSIGTGSFASFVPPVTIGAGPMQGIAFADFDRDGRADFAAVTDGLSVALGHGNGTFTPVPAAPLPGTASDGDAHPLLAGDVNGDGLPDLVVSTEFFGGQVAVSLGEGDGTFQPGQTFDALSPSEPLLVDVDNDGRPDIVTLDRLSPPAVSVHIGNGDGTFQDAHGLVAIESSTIALFDFDGNGTLDIVGDSVAAGHGDGTFDAPASPSAGFILPNADSVRDWNGDGKLDFVGLPTGTAQPNGDVEFPSVILELGNGDGTFQARASMVRNFNRIVGVGSFDSDCQPDLVIYGPFGVEVLHGRADGTFLEGIANLAPAQRDQASVIGDFDGDGRLDLVVAGQGGVSLLRGDGGGAFAVGVDLLAQPVFGAAAGDVDEDGHLDLALTRTDPAGYVVVLRGRGDGTFAPPAPLLPGKHVQGVTGDHVIALADVDSDGHADLVVATEIDGVLLLPGNGDGSFQAARTWSVAPDTGWYPDAIALGDINGDGRTDAVVTFSSIGISHHIVALPLSTCGM